MDSDGHSFVVETFLNVMSNQSSTERLITQSDSLPEVRKSSGVKQNLSSSSELLKLVILLLSTDEIGSHFEAISPANCRLLAETSVSPFIDSLTSFDDRAHSRFRSLIMYTRPEDVKQTTLSSSGDTAMLTMFSCPCAILAKPTAFASIKSHRNTMPSTPQEIR